MDNLRDISGKAAWYFLVFAEDHSFRSAVCPIQYSVPWITGNDLLAFSCFCEAAWRDIDL